jgi:hypothetical protein
MGKQSKRRPNKASAATASGAVANSVEGIATATDTFPPDVAVPDGGWVVELLAAEKAVKKQSENPERLLRVSRAYRMMRQWKKLKDSTEKAMGLESTRDEFRSELSAYKRKAEKQLAVKSRVEDLQHEGWFRNVFNRNAEVDRDIFLQTSFNNLNCLQYATLQGDVELLERVVALGAAIDYPPGSEELDNSSDGGEAAPPDCTAIVLACSILAQYGVIGKAPGLLTKELKHVLKGSLECAIQLVHLGADCQAKLVIPESSRGMFASTLRHFGLNNKTAMELAVISGKTDLIETMKKFKTEEDTIRLAHCRCGSRLPWKDCHSGEFVEGTPIHNHRGERLSFRYSPLAHCPCKNTEKTYYDCCWLSSTPTYHHDKKGELFGDRIMPMNAPGMRELANQLAQLKVMAQESGMDMNAPIFGNRSRDEMRSGVANMVRTMGVTQLIEASGSAGKMREMDPEVYAGCIERIDNWFHWRDDHWNLDKSELLQRVKEWNEALEKYCDDEGLIGEERRAVIKLNKASPLAPCANPSCDAFEKKAKGFSSCSRCRTVAYCSRSCQKEHWKTHKKSCIPR